MFEVLKNVTKPDPLCASSSDSNVQISFIEPQFSIRTRRQTTNVKCFNFPNFNNKCLSFPEDGKRYCQKTFSSKRAAMEICNIYPDCDGIAHFLIKNGRKSK